MKQSPAERLTPGDFVESCGDLVSVETVQMRMAANGDNPFVADCSDENWPVGTILPLDGGGRGRIKRYVTLAEFRAWQARNCPEYLGSDLTGYVFYELEAD